MDLFIATEIMGGAVFPYSTDLNAAWIVWQRISKSYQLLIADNKGSTEIFRVFETKTPEPIARAHTGAHAICLAASNLLAR